MVPIEGPSESPITSRHCGIEGLKGAPENPITSRHCGIEGFKVAPESPEHHGIMVSRGLRGDDHYAERR